MVESPYALDSDVLQIGGNKTPLFFSNLKFYPQPADKQDIEKARWKKAAAP